MAAAWRLREAGRNVEIYEVNATLGGVMQTRSVEGYTYETGPNTVRGNSRGLVEWLGELGLSDAIVESLESAKKRYIWRHGRLHEVPTGPVSFLTSGLLSFKGKMRLRAEKKQPVAPDSGAETLRQFFDRRIGAEATAAFVDPFVAGVFAGHPNELGTDAFPILREMEKTYGSLLKGLRAKKLEGQGAGSIGLIGLKGGWKLLPQTVASLFEGRVHCGHRLVSLERKDAGYRCSFQTESGDKEVEADEVVLALPSYEAARVLKPFAVEASDVLDSIPHPHVAVIGLGYKRSQIAHPLDGFGLLVPSDQPLPAAPSVLGILFPSSIFPDRTPEDCVSILVMVGGSRDPSAREASDHALEEQAVAAVRRVLGGEGRPGVVHTVRWPRAIPQYLPGHRQRIHDAKRTLGINHGLALAGNYLQGVSVEDSVQAGFSAASQLLGES
jgi:protoporphyrinogen/coproporphyrinogen III oxidase